MYGPGDVRVEERDEPRLVEATDAIIRVSAACVCGSDLWPYRGIEELAWPAPMGHEYVGIVEEVGAEVETIKPGQFVVGSFWGSHNTSRSAGPATRAPASTASRCARWERRPSGCASHSPMAPSSPHRSSLRMI
jgi:NADPH:quinone reductase-like Zn-dependent oxidoreductase